MFDFTDKTVVVTGGTKGLGASIVRRFHAQGARVLFCAREESQLADELGARAKFFRCDVRSVSELEALANEAVAWTGTLDVWINNAGRSGWKSIARITEDFWQTMVDINLKGTHFGCRAAATRMQDGGSIINISSLAGKRGSANNSVYCAAKFGVNGLTQALAKELGARQIRVNALCPVLITTPGLDEALEAEDAPASEAGIDKFLDGFARSNAALGRLPVADDVANYCLFLASDAAQSITGQCINVDCGVFPQ